VTSTTDIQRLNTSGQEVLSATSLASTCTATPTGVSGYTTVRNVPITVDAPGVLANDTDADGNSLAVTSFTQPPNGSGTVTVKPDGSFTFTPLSRMVGSTGFTCTVTDGNGGSDTTFVSVNLDPDPRECNNVLATRSAPRATKGSSAPPPPPTTRRAAVLVRSLRATSIRFAVGLAVYNTYPGALLGDTFCTGTAESEEM